MNNTEKEMESISIPSRKNLEEKFCDFLRRWPKIHELYCKYEEILVYLVIGFLTTVVSMTIKFLFNYIFFDNIGIPLPWQNAVLSTVSWASGVMFAYPTNRIYVFKSHNPIFKEAYKFTISRVSTWILDFVVVILLCNICGIVLWVSTIISAILVVIANYILSKLAVFKKEKK